MPAGGQTTKKRAQKVPPKKNVGAVPGVGPVAKPKRPAPKHVGRVPGVGPVAKPPSQHLQQHRQNVGKQVAQKTPGVAGAVSPHLARHRENKIKQQAHRVAAKPRNQIPGVSNVVNPHLAEHRRNRAVKEKFGTTHVAQAQAKVKRGPSVGSVVEHVVGGSPIGEALGISGKDVVHEAKKVVSSVNPGQGLSPSSQSALYPGSVGRAKQTIEHDIPKATKSVMHKLDLDKKVSPADQLTGGPGGVPGGAQFAKNVGKGIVDFPRTSVETGYAAGKAAVEAAQGNPESAKKLAEGLTHGVVGSLVRGKPEEALKYAYDNPVPAALEVAGVHSAVGRGAGAVARSRVAPKAVRKAASTNRAPKDIGYGQVKTQHYSKNLLNKPVQVMAEKARGKPTHHEIAGKQVTRPIRATKRKVGIVRDEAQRDRAMDVTSDTRQAAIRRDRERSQHTIEQARPVRKYPRPEPVQGIRRVSPIRAVKIAANAAERKRSYPEQGIVDLVGRGQVRTTDKQTFKQDLQKAHDTFVNEGQNLEGKAAEESQSRVERIRAVMADPKAIENFKAVEGSAKAFRAAERPVTQAKIETKALHPAQAERRRLTPYAISHMGAREGEAVTPLRTSATRTEKDLKTLQKKAVNSTDPVEIKTLKKQITAATKRLKYEKRLAGAEPKTAFVVPGKKFEPTGYHGTSVEPDVVLREGLNSGGRVHLATHDRRGNAEAYLSDGGFLYAADTKGLRTGDKGGGEFLSHEPIPAHRLRLVPETQASISRSTADRLIAGLDSRADASLIERLRSNRIEKKLTRGEAQKIADLTRRSDDPAGERLHRNLSTWLEAAKKHVRPDEGEMSHLPTSAIKAHMKKSGVNPEGVAYIRTATEGENAGQYTTVKQGRGGASKKFRGGSITKGTGKSGYTALKEEASRQRVELGQIKTHDRVVKQIARKDETGKPEVHSLGAAEVKAGRLKVENNEEWVPIRLHPAQHQAESVAIRDLQRDRPRSLITRADDENFNPLPEERTARIWGLAPKHQLDRLHQLEGIGSSDLGKAGQAMTRQFTRTVLPFSVKWLFGNNFEAAGRSALRGVSPTDPILTHRILQAWRKIDAQAAGELEAGLKNRGIYGAQNRMKVRRKSEGVNAPLIRLPWKAAEHIREAPILKQAFDSVGKLQDAVMYVNSHTEDLASTAVFGKFARREIQEMTLQWDKGLTAQKQIIEDLINNRLVHPEKIQEGLKYVDDALGRYRRLPPGLQKAVQGLVPFLPWYLNSVKFFTYTLPIEHPAVAAMLANMEVTMQKEFEKQHKAVPPGDLEYAIPQGKDKFLNLAHFTPAGAFTGKFYGLENAADLVLPQFSGARDAASAQTFFGKTIKDATDGQRALLLLNAFVTAFVPGANVTKTILEGGHSAEDTSTIFTPKGKQGGAYQSPAERLFNPLRPTVLGGKNKSQQDGKKKSDSIFGAPPSKKKAKDSIFG